jgi:hypothetical protein
MVTESRSLLLRATCYEDGGAPVARDGSQPAGANDAEALARPDASSQPCSEGVGNARRGLTKVDVLCTLHCLLHCGYLERTGLPVYI